MIRVAAAVLIVLCASVPAAARADDCTAIPDSGPMPDYLSLGSTFSGPVVEVIDGDSLCVAVGPQRGSDWVEVRLSDFYAPELDSTAGPAAKLALERVAYGKQASCTASLRTYDRIAARCWIGGRAIGDLMRSAGISEGGRGVGETPPPIRRNQQRAGGRSPVPAGLSCSEIRARGGARRGDPGYRPDWDGDGDGIACEPYAR